MSELQTDRLILRPFTEADMPAYRKMWGNPNVTKWLSSTATFGPETADRALAGWTKHLDEHGYAPWAVIRKTDNALMGHCGLQWLKEFELAEIMYAFDEPYWGDGYATESAIASVAYGLGALRMDKVMGMAFEDNIPSCRVLEKSGLSYQKRVNFHGDDLLYFERVGT